MAKPVKFVADVQHVKEVSLLGRADLAYWTGRLSGEGLNPLAVDGEARLLLIAAELKWKGVRFSELSFSVLLQGEPDEPRDQSYLLVAYNSSRLLAFCERAFFSTPYDHGDVRTAVTPGANIELAFGSDTAFRAVMQNGGDTPRKPLRSGEEGWNGPVYLPRKSGSATRPCTVFIARITGLTKAYEFSGDDDVFDIRKTLMAPPLAELIESRFRPMQWILRPDARHAKSKTYRSLPDIAGH
jgi:hypothetical protein